ncbi:MAG: hypothetical protein SNJ82_12270 [Gemmataceae bacterium]
MNTSTKYRYWLVRVGFLGGLIVLLGAEADRDTLERNAQRLEKWKDNPEQYAKLLSDLRSFYALPPERQAALRDIDAKIHSGSLVQQARAWGVLERYNEWLDSLSNDDRRRVLDAPNAAERLQVIRFLRDRDWVERASPVVSMELAKLPPDKRLQRIRELREQERRQRRLWDRSLPPRDDLPRPRFFEELPAEVQEFVRNELAAQISPEAIGWLLAAEGLWPEYPQRLMELTRAYVSYRPHPSLGPIRGVRDLPNDLAKLYRAEKGRAAFKGLNQKQGWPDFAIALERALRESRLPCPELGVCRLQQYPSSTQEFIRSQFADHLSELRKLEGQWPQFPQRLLELAKSRGVVIPGLMLPGPPKMWQEALR